MSHHQARQAIGINTRPIGVGELVEALPGLIESVSIGKPTMEDVFIHVTGRRLRQEEVGFTSERLSRSFSIDSANATVAPRW